jgi:predicted nucleic acid-binding Zn ribbon protein
MSPSDPKPLGTLLTALLHELGLSKKIQQYDVVISWAEIVGERIARVTEAYKIEKGILFVRVRTSEWRNELMMRKPEILQKINVRETVVKDIVFR